MKTDRDALLRHNGLGDFGALWDLEAGWTEEPNARRGGWSGVSRIELADPSGGAPVGVFLKRQENHTTWSLRPLALRRPTFAVEYDNIGRLRSIGVPVPEVVFFEQRVVGGAKRAILATRALDGYRPLSDLIRDWERAGWPPRGERRQVADAIAEVVARLHGAGWRHGVFHPKHIFIDLAPNPPVVCLIDLEKAERWLSRTGRVLEDLGPLYRRCQAVPLKDRLYFFRRALASGPRLSRRDKALWRRIYD